MSISFCRFVDLHGMILLKLFSVPLLFVCFFISQTLLPPQISSFQAHPLLFWEDGLPQVSPHPGTSGLCQIRYILSSPIEARQGSHANWAAHVLHTCQGPLSSLCMFFGQWLSLWELPEIQVNWLCWSSCGVSHCLQGLQSFPNSSIPKLCPIFGCGYLHLFQSTTG